MKASFGKVCPGPMGSPGIPVTPGGRPGVRFLTYILFGDYRTTPLPVRQGLRAARAGPGATRRRRSPTLATSLKLPFATATFTSPPCAALPHPTWAPLGPPEPPESERRRLRRQRRASRAGSSSACSRLEAPHRHSGSGGHGILLRDDPPPGPGQPGGLPEFPAARRPAGRPGIPVAPGRGPCVR